MRATIQEGACDLGMSNRGGADAYEIEFAEKLVPIGNRRNLQMIRNLLPRQRIGICHRNEINSSYAAILGRVMPAENSAANHRSP
jgi:hypothetical protein